MEKFTLGVEEEYMVIDPHTRELKSHDQKIVEIASQELKDHVKAEMHQAVVEVGTGICAKMVPSKRRYSFMPPKRALIR